MDFEGSVQNSCEHGTERHESVIPFMVVFRVRHGDTEYKEQLRGEMEDDLTDFGKEQIRVVALSIRERLDPERDIVWVVASPRIRTQDSKRIIEDELRASGIEIWDGTRKTMRGGQHEATFERIRNFDFLTDGNEGEPETIPTSDRRYPEVFQKVVADLESEREGVSASQQAFWSQHPQLEKYADRVARTRNQLTYLARIAKKIQPTISRRIVIIQVEHNESIDDLIEHATRGARTEKYGTGVPKGGVVEVHFPTDPKNNEIEVTLLDTDEKFMIEYDPDKRGFSQAGD